MKLSAIFSLMLLGVTAFASADTPSASLHYSVTEIHNLAVITQMSNDRQMIGGNLSWLDGKVPDIGTLPGDSWSQVMAVNKHGLVLANSNSHGFLWKDGKRTPLNIQLGGEGALANCGLNDNDVVVAWRSIAFPPEQRDHEHVFTSETRLFKWRDARVLDLGKPEGLDFGDKGHLINNKEEIAGENDHNVFFWSDGKRQIVCAMTGFDSARAIALNDAGQVAGIRIRSKNMGNIVWGDAYEDAFLWSKGQLQILPTLPGCTKTFAVGLNDRGQMIGYVDFVPNGGEKTPLPLFWQNGSVYNLNDLIPKNSGCTLTRPFAVNNAGEIVCHGYTNESERIGILHGSDTHTYVLTPASGASSIK